MLQYLYNMYIVTDGVESVAFTADAMEALEHLKQVFNTLNCDPNFPNDNWVKYNVGGHAIKFNLTCFGGLFLDYFVDDKQFLVHVNDKFKSALNALISNM
ncbi:MAG: hypothetical protein NC548_11175 [Lachnospiraceae bacterium]|nr:hypothetical protein [Lachnospiraceae bacterium]